MQGLAGGRRANERETREALPSESCSRVEAGKVVEERDPGRRGALASSGSVAASEPKLSRLSVALRSLVRHCNIDDLGHSYKDMALRWINKASLAPLRARRGHARRAAPGACPSHNTLNTATSPYSFLTHALRSLANDFMNE